MQRYRAREQAVIKGEKIGAEIAIRPAAERHKNRKKQWIAYNKRKNLYIFLLKWLRFIIYLYTLVAPKHNR